MFVFYNPETLDVEHVVVHAPDDYKETIKGLSYIETNEDIPLEEISISKDRRVVRAVKEPEKKRPAIVDLAIMKEQANKQIDAAAFVGIEPFLVAQKYAWATSDPVENAIKLEAQMKGFTLEEMIDRVKSEYKTAMNKLQRAELNRIKAHLSIEVALDESAIQYVLNNFDPFADIDSL